jgi:TolB-like protein
LWVLPVAVAVGVLISGAARADEVGGAGEIDLRARVVILPMVVNSTGEQAYLRSGLSDMLASRLGRNPGVAVLRVDETAQATTDPLRAARLGLEMGAQYVVFGSFTQFGEGASLDVQCVEARAYDEDEDPAARRIFVQTGTVGEIIPKLDETAQKIGRFVATPLPAVATAPDAPAAVGAPAPAPAAGPPPELEELRRRLDAIEEYLFGQGGTGEPVADAPIPSDTATEFGVQ